MRIGTTTLEPADYLEALTASVFQSGLSAQVVTAKWKGFTDAFSGFNPQIVANLTPEDVESLVADERIIRNRRKIEATVENARRLIEIESEIGFSDWLDSAGSPEATISAIGREFKFLGPTGARLFLAAISDNVEVC